MIVERLQPIEVERFVSDPLSKIPCVLPFDGVWPQLAGEPRFCGPSVAVLGKVELGARAALAARSVIRADGHFIRIGDDFSLGAESTIHIAGNRYPTLIGRNVAVGRASVIHACTLGNHCVIGDGSVVLDGSVVEDFVLVEPGSIVFPRSNLKTGRVYGGSPAKPIRSLTPDEFERHRTFAEEGICTSPAPTLTAGTPIRGTLGAEIFVAETAWLSARVETGADASIFFSCHLDAGSHSIVIGRRSNVQDNTRIAASQSNVVIGEDTTIGHNVRLESCVIGDRSLIGIGSDLAAGSIVENDVLVAAGSTTDVGQRLEQGWVWGGRPARPLSKLDDAKRAMMQAIIEQYCVYGRAYRLAQGSTHTGGQE